MLPTSSSEPAGVPPIAVVVPARDAARHLERTLASVLDQRHPAAEIIVVDDASSDATAGLLERLAERHPRLVVHRTDDNVGVCRARNLGMELATSPLICMLDADDLLHPDALAELHAALLREPDAVLAFAGAAIIDDGDTVRHLPAPIHAMPAPLDVLEDGNALICGSGVLFRRDDARRVGGYDETLRQRCNEICGDWTFYLSMGGLGPFAAVPRHLVGYRRHARSMSEDIGALVVAYEDILGRIEATRGHRHPGSTARTAAQIARRGVTFRWFLLRRALQARRFALLPRILGAPLRHAPLAMLSYGARRAGARATRRIVRVTGRSSGDSGSEGLPFAALR